jgi:hypothetical protein
VVTLTPLFIMKIRILRNVSIRGVHYAAGTIADVSAEDAAAVIVPHKAEPCVEVVEVNPTPEAAEPPKPKRGRPRADSN